MPFTIVRQDLTKMDVDALVCAANTSLQSGGGVCGTIFKAAGTEQLQEACYHLAPIQIGEAVITPGFNLKAKYVIHTAGPVYSGGNNGEARLLRLSYLNSLRLAIENHCSSIAFPLISSGLYRYPKREALQVARDAIQDFLKEYDLDVYLAVYDRDAFTISEKLLGEVASYLDDNYLDEHLERRPRSENDLVYAQRVSESHSVVSPLEDLVGNLDEPFSETLFRLIDAKGKTDVEVYKQANLDRRLFSKIRSNKAYMPGKRTVIALAIGLELSLEETNDLLKRAGFALSHSQLFDVIVEYFIIHKNYNVFEINEALFRYDQPLLGG